MKVTPLKTVTVGIGVVAAALSFSACGSDDNAEAEAFAKLSVEEIGDEAEKAMKGLSSMRFAGTMTQDGGEMKLDLAVDTDGTCTGTIAMDEGSAEIIVIGSDQYMKGNEQFWIESLDETRGPQVDDLVGDRWVMLPQESSDFSEFCDLDSFLDEFDNDDEDDEEPTKSELVDVDGVQALELTTEEDGGTTTVLVSAEEPHYLLKVSNDGDEPGSFTFSDFDEPVNAEAPDEDDIVDMTELAGS